VGDPAVDDVRGGVPQAHVVDGRQAHSVLTEVFTTQGVGTMVLPDDLRTGSLPVVRPAAGAAPTSFSVTPPPMPGAVS
jgi:hypothetical protein